MFHRDDILVVLPNAPYRITVPGSIVHCLGSSGSDVRVAMIDASEPGNNGTDWHIPSNWLCLATSQEIHELETSLDPRLQSSPIVFPINGLTQNGVIDNGGSTSARSGYVAPVSTTTPVTDRLPGGFTLGWELESITTADEVPNHVNDHEDGSVSGDGMEYVSTYEVRLDSKLCIRALKELLDNNTLDTDTSCGFHVHLGLPGNSRKQKSFAAWMVTLGRLVEEKAFKAVPGSRRSNQYCKSLSTNLDSVKDVPYVSSKLSNHTRYHWLNVVEMFRPGGIRTVEIRLLGNTTRWEYLYAWISACHLMGQAAMRLITDPSSLAKEARELNEMFETIACTFLGGSQSREEQKKVYATLAHKAKIGPAYVAPRFTEAQAIEEAVEWGWMQSRIMDEDDAMRYAIRHYRLDTRLTSYDAYDEAMNRSLAGVR